MNGYEKAQKLGLTGDDKQQVQILQTITASPLPVSEVIQWLDEQGLWKPNPIEGGFKGSFINFVKDDNYPVELRDGVETFLAHAAKRSSLHYRLDQIEHSILAAQFIGGLNAVGVLSAEQVASFYSLGGGLLYRDLTVEQFVEQRTEAEAQAAARAARDHFEQVVAGLKNDGGINEAEANSDLTALAVAYRSAADTIDALATTPLRSES